jgi:hypothetical protein
VDGVEIVASLVLLTDRRTGHRSGWLPWAALMVGTAASLAANIATADPSAISRTRDRLATCLRQAGHPVRYSRLTPLLQALRRDEAS